jgi:hypothetical protein
MERAKLDLSIIVLMTAIVIGGCVPRLSDPNVSMIALRGQTGLLGQSFRIEFRRDGMARIECYFYDLREGKPRSDFKLLCDDLYRQFPASFRVNRNQLEGQFSGRITPEKFFELSKTLNDNGYFSMNDGWEFDGRLDAPPDFVEVEFDGTKKEVGDSGGKKNEAFSAIKGSLYELGKATNWES